MRFWELCLIFDPCPPSLNPGTVTYQVDVMDVLLASTALHCVLAAPIWRASGQRWRIPMDYLVEAKKFIQRAHSAYNSEVKDQHLAMADWCLSQAIQERDGVNGQ